jgi:hypothetical protein
MKDRQLLRAKVIKTEDDLPKEEECFISHDKIARRIIHKCNYREHLKEYWLRNIDWYLQHEQITDSDIEAWAEEYCSKCSSSFDETLKYGIKLGAKAALNGEIKHIEK